MTKYLYGDWVMYSPVLEKTNSEPQIGRVVEDMGAAAQVCYHSGCTSALTQKDFLRRATRQEVSDHLALCCGDSPIGHNRFKNECPEMDPECCFMCRHCHDLEVA